MIPIRHPWTRQPQTAARVDWSNPLARGLVVAAIPVGGRFFEVVTGQLSGAIGTVATGATIDGNRAPARRVVNPGSGSVLTNPTGADSITGAWTVFAETSPETSSAHTVFASTEPASGYGFSCRLDDTLYVYNGLLLGNSYTGSNVASLFGALGSDSELYVHRAAWAWDTTNAFFYTKRQLNKQEAYSGAITAAATRRSYFLTSVGGYGGAASASLIAVWNRAISLAEYQALYDNPWQLFAPIERRIWVPVSVSGGGTTVSVPAGSLTITGNAPTVLTPRTIAVPKGELTLTGNAPTVSTPIVVSVPVGSLSLTGFAPTVVTPRTIPVPAGTLSLTGFAPTVTAGGGQVVQVPAGSIVLTGYAPVVVAPRTISVPAGSLAITGYAPTVLNSTIVSIPAGSLTLTGFAPSVVATANKYISVPSGTLTLTGYAPTVSSGSLTIYFWKRTA